MRGEGHCASILSYASGNEEILHLLDDGGRNMVSSAERDHDAPAAIFGRRHISLSMVVCEIEAMRLATNS